MCLTRLVGSAAAAITLFLSWDAFAQMLANPIAVSGENTTLVEGALVLSTTEYDVGAEVDVERKILAATASLGIAPAVDLFGQFGFIFDSEIDDSSADDGSGFMLGIGSKFLMHSAQKIRVVCFGLLNMTREKFEGSGADVELSVTDLHGGGTLAYATSPKVQLFGGLDLALLSDGKAESKVAGFTAKTDAERSENIGLRFGANLAMGSGVLVPEVILFGETTLLIGYQAAL